MVEITAINSDAVPSYAFLDKGSGRCRISNRSLQQLCPNAKIGSVLKLKLFAALASGKLGAYTLVLCTIWPDTLQMIEDNSICLDASIFINDTALDSDWAETKCEIVEVLSPKPCSSIRYKILGPMNIRSLIPSLVAGLPVQSKTLLSLTVNNQAFSIYLSRTNPEGTVVCSNATILIEEKDDMLLLPSSPSKIPQSPVASVSRATEETKTATTAESTILAPKQAFSCTSIVTEIIHHVIQPFLHQVPEILRYKGIMLLGPPGVGKSFALSAVQQYCRSVCDVQIVKLSIPDLLAEEQPMVLLDNLLPKPKKPLSSSSSSSSSSPKKSSQHSDLLDNKTNITTLPCAHFLLIDEIDALGNAQNQNELQMAIKTKLCAWLDTPLSSTSAQSFAQTYCMVATSNRSEDIDPIFRRGGRLEYELHVLNRTEDRKTLLATYLQHLLHSLQQQQQQDQQSSQSLLNLQHVNDKVLQSICQQVAEKTGGYVAADIAALIRESASALETYLLSSTSAVLSSVVQTNTLIKEVVRCISITMKTVPPSCLRGISITLPKLSFDDIIGYADIKTILSRSLAFLSPEQHALLARFNMTSSLGGILFYGPPGNSKTRFVKALASMYSLPLISLTSADVYSAYVGDAEAEIRKAFTIARQASPCILFFDELDSLVINRATADLSSNATSVEARVLSTFLNEMDGVTANANAANGVIVMGATNRIDCIDAALIRKGRFYQSIHVPPPNEQERQDLLRYFIGKMLILSPSSSSQQDHKPINRAQEEVRLFDELVDQLFEGMSGAQVEGLCREKILEML